MSLGPVTEDGFLGGRLRLRQPKAGYRAATDPVFLAACVPAQPGQAVLDLGCGAGAALFCLGTRVAGLRLHGLEIQPDYAALARENAALNGLQAMIFEGDVTQPDPALRALSFDHVLANPPFYDAGAATAPQDQGRDVAHRINAAGLESFVDQGLRRLRPGGTFSIIHRTAQLGALLTALEPRLGDIRVLPLTARAGRDAKRVLVQGRKGARGPLALRPPFIIHAGAAHGVGFTPMAEAILRDGAALGDVNICWQFER